MVTVPSELCFCCVKVHRCTVVKLPLSKRSSMLLVLPEQGTTLQEVELQLQKNIMSDWIQNLHEGSVIQARSLAFSRFSPGLCGYWFSLWWSSQDPGAEPPQVLPVLHPQHQPASGQHESRGRGQHVRLRGRVQPTERQRSLQPRPGELQAPPTHSAVVTLTSPLLRPPRCSTRFCLRCRRKELRSRRRCRRPAAP